jgi:membrane-anchored protein YejM (alkaline phosphatase superfamily)
MSPSRPVRLVAVVLAWLLATVAGAAVGTAWLPGVSVGASVRSALFVPAALLSDTAMLAVVPALVVALLCLVVPSRRALAFAQALVWALFLLLLYTDTRIWRLFRYHFNGMVWNLIWTPGTGDSIDLGPGAWASVAAAGVAILAASALLWSRWLLPAAEGGRAGRWARRGGALVLALVLLEKGLYAWADLARDRTVTSAARAFPLYQRLTVQKVAERVFHARLEQRAQVRLGGEGLLLKYPLEEPRVDPKGPRPNILVVVIDSLRADMLAEQTMPRTTAFAARARRFEDHLAGGNATRFGVFSLIYGIHGTYWMPVLEEHAPPVLLTVLAKLGYDLRVLATSSLSSPEFRSTAFVAMEDRVEDHLGFDAKEKGDARIPERFDAWLDGREKAGTKAPFFCFALIDAPHGNYAWPAEETVFRPFAARVDYLEMAGSPAKERVQAVYNSYRNAVHFGDELAGRMIDSLERRRMLDDTIVVVTGDHGEEFFEHGYFGHTSNFAPEQTHVPFVMAGPGIPVGVERRPTCHVDLAPTILELLGADPSRRAQWSQGESLLSPPERRDRVIGGWEEVALRVEGGILRVPLEGSRGFVEAYDLSWKRLDDERGLIARSAPAIAKLALDCRKFLR